MSGQEQVRELLLQWDKLREVGRSVSAEELCRDHPDLLAEVQDGIAAQLAMHRVPPATLPAEETPGAANVSSSSGSSPKTPRLDGYEILEELGSGGMGVVFKARQIQLKRLVAIKMVRAGAHAGSRELARFRIEAEAAARLQHPHIVQLFEIAEHNGCPYLVMEFVDGPSLADRLRRGALPIQVAAELLRSLARAVHHGHQRQIVHRDLKPANVLLAHDVSAASARHERPDSQLGPRWIPKIADFGLAKLLDAKVDHTHPGTVLGSPGYMAPEQADGRIQDIGPATDTYALGTILYEMLTGRAVFVAATLVETLEQVRSQEPVPPSRLNKRVPRDLESICLKCLEKDKRRRYVSAEALAEDLDRYLNGELIAATNFGFLDRLARAVGRAPGSGQFRTINSLLLLLSPAPLLANLLVFVLIWWESRYAVAAVAAMLLVGPVNTAILFIHNRRQAVTTMSPGERQLWSVWSGVGMGTAVLFLAFLQPPTPDVPYPILEVYPAVAALHGLAFFAMGASLWGGFYVAGVAFFLSTLCMRLNLRWAPLEFGAILSLVLGYASLHFKRRKS